MSHPDLMHPGTGRTGIVPPFPLALCVDRPDLPWIPTPTTQLDDVAEARALCWRCPEREPCAQWGLLNREVGIWGGWDNEQRRVVRRVRGLS